MTSSQESRVFVALGGSASARAAVTAEVAWHARLILVFSVRARAAGAPTCFPKTCDGLGMHHHRQRAGLRRNVETAAQRSAVPASSLDDGIRLQLLPETQAGDAASASQGTIDRDIDLVVLLSDLQPDRHERDRTDILRRAGLKYGAPLDQHGHAFQTVREARERDAHLSFHSRTERAGQCEAFRADLNEHEEQLLLVEGANRPERRVASTPQSLLLHASPRPIGSTGLINRDCRSMLLLLWSG